VTEWRYMPGGAVVHALAQPSHAGAWCGRYVLPASAWMGTGCQAEYETAERLPKCKQCVAKVGDPQ
jgi:hypothetical protein